MSDNIFQDLDLENVADDPFALTVGTWPAITIEPEYLPAKPDKPAALIFKYEFLDGPNAEAGLKASEWKTFPDKDDTSDRAKTSRSFIKQRLFSLGFTKEQIENGEVTPDKIAGIHVALTLTRRGEYTNVTKVVLMDDSAVASGNPFI